MRKNTTKVATGFDDDDEDDEKEAQRMLDKLGIDHSVLQMGEFHKHFFIPVGIPEIDKLLTNKEGHVGIPAGTLAEFCGESMSGKTYMAYKHMAEHQKLGRRVAYMDLENTFYADRAKELGVDINNKKLFQYYSNVGPAETWGDLVLAMIDSGRYGLIVIDSIKVMVPIKDDEKSMSDTDNTMNFPKFIRKFLTRANERIGIAGRVSREDPKCFNTTLVVINHMTTSSGSAPNTFIKAPAGGSGVDYLMHMRIHMSKIKGDLGRVIAKVEGENKQIGGRSRVLIYKTRFGIPEGKGEFVVSFGDYKQNPLSDFVFRAMSHREEFITRLGRKPNYIYRYVDKTTGNVIEADNDFDLVEKLMVADPPTKRVKGDNSETALEFITGRMKMGSDQIESLMKKMDSIRSGESAHEDLGDDNPFAAIPDEDAAAE